MRDKAIAEEMIVLIVGQVNMFFLIRKMRDQKEEWMIQDIKESGKVEKVTATLFFLTSYTSYKR